MHYYAIRIMDDGQVISQRIAKANNPRVACLECYGVIYAEDDNVKYLDYGTRAPKYLSMKRKLELEKSGPWLPIPRTVSKSV